MNNLDNNKVEFTFGWLALRLLGKSLYSNAWSAISELVANGFDAQANNVYIYINIHKKNNVIIEIFDDGKGMSHEDMQIYAKVGHNKRTALKLEGKEISSDIMGRKGIGKLAALYLSESYYILTKSEEDSSGWRMNYNENQENENTKPHLIETEIPTIPIDCQNQWNPITTGTLIRLNKVNLSGFGDEAFNALKNKLSNYFSLDSMNGRAIHLCIRNNNLNEIKFEELKKTIAFKNMDYITYSESNDESINSKIKKLSTNCIEIPLDDSLTTKRYNHYTKIIPFSEIPNVKTTGVYKNKKYNLNGWIGIHESIETKKAKVNDEDFIKNKFYNPIQLRLYIRNKLAIENFINIINNNQTFINYIEGEINFDILDDDDFPDIATSNRQGLDEHDDRVQLLKSIISDIVQFLIRRRNELASEVKKLKKEIKDKRSTNAKSEFGQELNKELNNTSLSTLEKSELSMLLMNKLQGDVSPKEKYILFFSHSRKNKQLMDFFYNILIKKGITPGEIFYTSKEDDLDKFKLQESLSNQIKENIINENALIFYLTSKEYNENQYCLFEGGAGWATRSIGEYILLPTEYEYAPEFLTNGKPEYVLMRDNKISLNKETYFIIVDILNKMIQHINIGRRIQENISIDLFELPKIPSDLDLCKEGKTIEDYMDKLLLEYWNFYVKNKI